MKLNYGVNLSGNSAAGMLPMGRLLRGLAPGYKLLPHPEHARTLEAAANPYLSSTVAKENDSQKRTKFKSEGNARHDGRPGHAKPAGFDPPMKPPKAVPRPSQRPVRGAAPALYRYIALHKPYGVLSQFTAEDGQPTLAQFGIPYDDVYTVGRLDKDSEGLLLLTNDTRLKARIQDTGVPKTYWAQVEGVATSIHADQLRAGVVIKGGYKTLPCGVRVLEPSEVAHIAPRMPPIRVRLTIPTSWLEVVLVEGKNRQVRSMTAAVGLPTLRLIRKRIGRLSLDQLGLGQGEWVETILAQIL